MVCRVMYVWIGVCVMGVVVYGLWVFLADVERDGGGSSSYRLGDSRLECGKDVCTIK